MRIVHYLCSARLIDGGVPKAAVDLSVRLGSAGHDVTFLTWDAELCPTSWKDGTDPRVKLIILEPASGPLGLFRRRQLAAFEREIASADVVHLHGMWTTSNLQVASIARRLGKPYVLSPHGMLDTWSMAQGTRHKKIFLTLVGHRLLRRSAFVHFTAQSELDQAKPILGRARGRVLPLAFDLDPYRELPGIGPACERYNLEPDGPIKLLFLSRIHPKKGLERLLHATRALIESGTAVKLLVAGSGDAEYERSLHELARTLGLDGPGRHDRVRFLGAVSGREKISLYQLADLMVLATSQENFGFVFFESLAAGTPLVTTRAVDTWRELERSGGAAIFDLPEKGSLEDQVNATVAAIRAALASRDELKSRGQKGRQWVLTEMDPARIIESFVEMYQAAMALPR